MQLQELVKLVEFEAVDKLYVTGTTGFYTITILIKGRNFPHYGVEVLERARGGNREFTSLDSVYNLTRKHLHNHQFTVLGRKKKAP